MVFMWEKGSKFEHFGMKNGEKHGVWVSKSIGTSLRTICEWLLRKQKQENIFEIVSEP